MQRNRSMLSVMDSPSHGLLSEDGDQVYLKQFDRPIWSADEDSSTIDAATSAAWRLGCSAKDTSTCFLPRKSSPCTTGSRPPGIRTLPPASSPPANHPLIGSTPSPISIAPTSTFGTSRTRP